MLTSDSYSQFTPNGFVLLQFALELVVSGFFGNQQKAYFGSKSKQTFHCLVGTAGFEPKSSN